ncbi:type II toxin-antitoxin system PemK/MazF family toxin [Candidatus Woesearchaeota archaeon]|nr:type II toxin-antitoxin system PemK/MazF family toxin [Candidatus Woesearchaeota archaeon]
MIEQGDLLLIPFPFSDQSGKKVRPVVVISNNDFNNSSEDIIVLGVTSNLHRDKYSIQLSSLDLEKGNLDKPCVIKVENILKIDKRLIIKVIGKINKNKLNEIYVVLYSILK